MPRHGRPQAPLLRLAPAIALAALAGALTASPAAAASGVPGPPTPRGSWIATVVAPVVARAAPDLSGRRVTVVQPTAPLGGGVTSLMVTGRVLGDDGRPWIRVRLPVRPNGTQGWIPQDVVRVRRTALRLRVDLSDRRLTLYRDGRVYRRVRVAVGRPEYPSPVGRFAVAELIRTRTPGAFLGPVVLPLTGFSERLNEYAGGNGRVAIHGTSVPQFLGTRASHGCIRVHNSDIVAIARIVRPGTPVEIVP
jgi:lipoprotein-anchoring transpeptidase ErfK/SrfK